MQRHCLFYARDAEVKRLFVGGVTTLDSPNRAWLLKLTTPFSGWPPDEEGVGGEGLGHEAH